MSAEHPDQDGDDDAVTHFEASLAELETLVESLESGDIGLQEALAQFERGVTLARRCESALKTAELRVEQLTGDGDQAAPFAATEESGE